MKFYKATLHKDLRNLDGVNIFEKYGVYYIPTRCTTSHEPTVMVFGDDTEIGNFMAEYGNRATMTLHHFRLEGMTAAEVVAVLERNIKVYPKPAWQKDDQDENI